MCFCQSACPFLGLPQCLIRDSDYASISLNRAPPVHASTCLRLATFHVEVPVRSHLLSLVLFVHTDRREERYRGDEENVRHGIGLALQRKLWCGNREETKREEVEKRGHAEEKHIDGRTQREEKHRGESGESGRAPTRTCTHKARCGRRKEGSSRPGQ